MVGNCTFEKEEKRAAKTTYSFERFDLLQRVNHIRVEFNGKVVPLNNEQRRIVIDTAHKSSNLNYFTIRKALNLEKTENVRFNAVRYSRDKADKDCEVAMKFSVLKAYHEMQKAFDKVSKDRIKSINIATRNEIGRIFTLYKRDETIREALEEIETLTSYDIEALVENLKTFSKFGHLSVKALNKIIPHLEKGLTYDKACTDAGYDFKGNANGQANKLISLQHLAEQTENTITSPVARRALSQCAKVINAIIRDIGTSPVYINIELAREMSNNFDERIKIDKSMKENQEKNEKAKEQIKEYGVLSPKGLDIVKFKLYKEQNEECPYSQTKLDISQLFDPGYAEIDHIMPYSQSFDDSYKNKVLVRAYENQQKGNRLPVNYLTGEKRDKFIVWVNNSNLSPAKKRNLLREEIPDDWKERNLTDTKTISTFMYNYLRNHLSFTPFTSERKRHVTAVNGAVTSMLRKRWGLNKVREDGDTHHALDAAVVACTTQGTLSMLTRLRKYYIEVENQFVDRKTGEVKEKGFPEPYKGFAQELEYEKLKKVFVSRMPNRKVSGAAHKETIKGIGDNNTQIKKVPLSSLKLDKDGEIIGCDVWKNDDPLLYNALKERLAEYGAKGEKAFEQSIHKPKSDGTPGPLVKKVKIAEKSTLNVLVHDKTGSADNGSMIRVDVFHVKGEGYFLVPIYVADAMNNKPLPKKAIVANKPYNEWKEMKDDDFIFSLYSNDLVYIKGKKSITFKKVNSNSKLPPTSVNEDGYFYYKGTHIGTGAINIIYHDNSYKQEGLGVKTLPLVEKWQVDVLGKISKVAYEQRKDFSEIKRR